LKIIDKLRVAISFLTTIPVPVPKDTQPEDFGRAAIWFSAVGLMLGAALGLLGWGAGMVFSPLIVGVLLTAAWAALTGGLHLDGLADCCDGMLSAAGVERRLEIMKDPRLGTFGGIGLLLVLLLKTALAAELAARGLWLAFPLAASLGRWFILIAARQSRARPGGLGDAFARGVQTRDIIVSLIVPVGLIIWSGAGSLVGVGAACLVCLGVISAARRLLGGVTGDVFGMVVELSETAVLLGMAIKPLW
jgi:adenosylcobinamide-GDP ribazoletransferase